MIWPLEHKYWRIVIVTLEIYNRGKEYFSEDADFCWCLAPKALRQLTVLLHALLGDPMPRSILSNCTQLQANGYGYLNRSLNRIGNSCKSYFKGNNNSKQITLKTIWHSDIDRKQFQFQFWTCHFNFQEGHVVFRSASVNFRIIYYQKMAIIFPS